MRSMSGKPVSIRVSSMMLVAVGVAFIAAVVLAPSHSLRPADVVSTTESAGQPRSDSSYTPTRFHGVAVDRLDNPLEPSLSLDEAVAKTGLELYLPSVAVVGRPVKVVMNETVTDPGGEGRVGFMVLYDSGVKLIVAPGSIDLQQRNLSLSDALPFKDGRALPYELKTVSNRPTLVGRAGIQYQGDAEITTGANLVWNMGDANYWLRAPAPPAATSDDELAASVPPIGISDLTKIAESMLPFEAIQN